MRTEHVSAHQIDQHLVAINSAPTEYYRDFVGCALMRTDYVSAHQIGQHLVAIHGAPTEYWHDFRRVRIDAHRYESNYQCLSCAMPLRR